jgi:hypothetical protein
MQNAGFGVPGIHLLGTSMNKAIEAKILIRIASLPARKHIRTPEDLGW